MAPDAGSPPQAGPAPGLAVGREVARALGAGLLLGPRLATYLATRARLRAEFARDLEEPARIDAVPDIHDAGQRSLRIFVACAEVSGEIHLDNALAALRRRLQDLGAPEPRIFGFGGPRLEAAGVTILGRPTERAQMGLGVARSIPYYAGLLADAARHFRVVRPDLCLAVDSPALHVPLFHIARAYGVRTLHFVTPQYWGWAPWRVAGYRRAVDAALSILPFEPSWFRRHGVRVAHVGHPLLDELLDVPRQAAGHAARDLVLLPGSRARVIEKNLDWMLDVAAELRARVGDVPVVVAHERAEIAPLIQARIAARQAAGWARLAVGDLHGVLARARAALSVSGTVLLDLLHHDLPAVVVYRLDSRIEAALSRSILTVPHFSSVNLLATREVYPEFCFHGEGPRAAVGEHLRRCYNDDAWRADCRAGLALARQRLGPPGASDRVAAHALALALSPP